MIFIKSISMDLCFQQVGWLEEHNCLTLHVRLHKIKCVKSVRQRAHMCTHKSAVPVFSRSSTRTSMCFFFWDETTIYRTGSHPWRSSTSSWKNRETEEAKMEFQPHHGLSAGGRHVCTQADNNGEETTGGGGGTIYFAAGWLAPLEQFSFPTYLQVLIRSLVPSVLQ